MLSINLIRITIRYLARKFPASRLISKVFHVPINLAKCILERLPSEGARVGHIFLVAVTYPVAAILPRRQFLANNFRDERTHVPATQRSPHQLNLLGNRCTRGAR